MSTGRQRPCSPSRRRWRPPTPTAPSASPGRSPTRATKEEALAAVAEALAVTDPGRAERIARSITGEYAYGAWALLSVAKALAATDPGRAARLITDAERAAQSITREDAKASALAAVAEALAATEPGRAERTARSITNEHCRASALAAVAEALAATDPDRAERTAQSITDEYLKASALTNLARAAVQHAADDPDTVEPGRGR
jgi:hypothetical protein